ncbi:hypothetical protein AWB82_04553 [Caballeronia glebae]|uniref:Hemolysin n=1 Tax=Caballeronia glebae TaxID=1777143 RepID=A0A158BWM6_9BURK|nr:DUF333 domain-containing protein [Caballeronia glebae]SAK73667.1 hypothetical protein AWB82_04553 [Caballeronia glebae]
MLKPLTVLIASLFLLPACTQPQPSTAGASTDQPASQSTARIGLANPASVNCTRQGGTLQIVDTGNGQLGMCRFPGGQSCEEWALFRGECSPGQK